MPGDRAHEYAMIKWKVTEVMLAGPRSRKGEFVIDKGEREKVASYIRVASKPDDGVMPLS